MARAKRTERAEARRRYRATLATDPGRGRRRRRRAASRGSSRAPTLEPRAGRQESSGTPERVGFLDAFKLSIRPVHVREDLASLPWITVHTKAIWVPILITVAATIATAATGARDMVTGLLFTYFVVFPAIGGVFIGGFLAPRASWLVGSWSGSCRRRATSCLAWRLAADRRGAVQPQPHRRRGLRIHLLADHGCLLRGRAAWYRRFLALSSPNRQRRQSQAPKQRPGDGRTRAKPSQKAGAKR